VSRPISAAKAALIRRSRGRAARETGGMKASSSSAARRRALRLYALGQALILAGAAGMAAWHSFVPMALAGSAALMLTVPIVKVLVARRRSAR
jgi:hypothetical protein